VFTHTMQGDKSQEAKRVVTSCFAMSFFDSEKLMELLFKEKSE